MHSSYCSTYIWDLVSKNILDKTGQYYLFDSDLYRDLLLSASNLHHLHIICNQGSWFLILVILYEYIGIYKESLHAQFHIL
ncbi:hypothetical protein D3C73_671220 [compost metagenome]